MVRTLSPSPKRYLKTRVPQEAAFVPLGGLIAPVEDAVSALKVGQISKPVQTRFGWNIFKLEEKRQQPLPTWDTLRDELAQQKVREVVSRLRRGAKIELLDKLNRAVVKP